MFERFTDRARRVMTLANQEAQRLGHDHVGTEHLLLGMAKEGSGSAANVLREFKIDLSALRQKVEQVGHAPNKMSPGSKLSLTERYRRVLNYAMEEAAALSNNYVGSEHLLLGLLREDAAMLDALAELGLGILELLHRIGFRLLWRHDNSPGMRPVNPC